MTVEEKLNLYRSFRERGVICLCTTCGEKNYCACSAVGLSAECFQCAVKRIEQAEKFNYEDFIRL